ESDLCKFGGHGLQFSGQGLGFRFPADRKVQRGRDDHALRVFGRDQGFISAFCDPQRGAVPCWGRERGRRYERGGRGGVRRRRRGRRGLGFLLRHDGRRRTFRNGRGDFDRLLRVFLIRVRELTENPLQLRQQLFDVFVFFGVRHTFTEIPCS